MVTVNEFQLKLKPLLGDAHSSHELARARQSAEFAKFMKAASYTVEDPVWVSRRLLKDVYEKVRPSDNLAARRFGPFAIKTLVENPVNLPFHHKYRYTVFSASSSSVHLHRNQHYCKRKYHNDHGNPYSLKVMSRHMMSVDLSAMEDVEKGLNS